MVFPDRDSGSDIEPYKNTTVFQGRDLKLGATLITILGAYNF